MKFIQSYLKAPVIWHPELQPRGGVIPILAELPRPLCIRRSVAFANTVLMEICVEDVESA